MLNIRIGNSLFTYLAMAFITMAGLSYINFLPGLVNALAGAIGFSDVEAGQIIALNGYGGLLGTTAAIFLVSRIRWQPAVFMSLAVLALMDIASARIDAYEAMLGWRFVAGFFVGLLERYPRFETVAFVIVGLAGAKLAVGGWDKFTKEVLARPEWVTGLDKTQFSLFILGVLILGTVWAMNQRRQSTSA